MMDSSQHGNLPFLFNSPTFEKKNTILSYYIHIIPKRSDNYLRCIHRVLLSITTFSRTIDIILCGMHTLLYNTPINLRFINKMQNMIDTEQHHSLSKRKKIDRKSRCIDIKRNCITQLQKKSTLFLQCNAFSLWSYFNLFPRINGLQYSINPVYPKKNTLKHTFHGVIL